MDNKINFKDLWAKQTSIEPNPGDLLLQISKMKRSNLRKLIVTNLMLVTVSAFIILIWIYYQPQLVSTKVGILLIILSMTIFLFAYNRSYTLFKEDINSKSNTDYLKELLAIKSKQQFMHTTMLNVYFILLSAGIGLYMYEYTSRMTIFWGIVAYGITLIWILFNWFYLRPKQIKKQQLKLDDMITKFKKLNNQLEA
ncbi:MAG: hypothetical protein IPL84_09120 [Chitinophagaceae bacterium]|nr:hypothetical protein [Chitinophagaceae bacterium]